MILIFLPLSKRQVFTVLVTIAIVFLLSAGPIGLVWYLSGNIKIDAKIGKLNKLVSEGAKITCDVQWTEEGEGWHSMWVMERLPAESRAATTLFVHNEFVNEDVYKAITAEIDAVPALRWNGLPGLALQDSDSKMMLPLLSIDLLRTYYDDRKAALLRILIGGIALCLLGFIFIVRLVFLKRLSKWESRLSLDP